MADHAPLQIAQIYPPFAKNAQVERAKNAHLVSMSMLMAHVLRVPVFCVSQPLDPITRTAKQIYTIVPLMRKFNLIW